MVTGIRNLKSFLGLALSTIVLVSGCGGGSGGSDEDIVETTTADDTAFISGQVI